MFQESRPHCLTFGVEFEFALAIVADRSRPHPELEGETRVLRIEPIAEDIKFTNDCFTVTHITIQDHISRALTSAGYPCESSRKAKKGYGKWEVKQDGSIREPACEFNYTWFEVELVSPAMWFCEESIQAVMNVCQIVTSTYLVHVNETCGFHVHVGIGNENLGKFKFSTLRNLYALLWAFEPQLDTLHPSHRQEGWFCQSLRRKTYKDKHGQMLKPLEGISAFLKCKDVDELAEVIYITRSQAYNISNALDKFSSSDMRYSKDTIEFRQHEATLDGERVKAWIKTVVGIVNFARDIELNPDYFTRLLEVAKFEVVEKDRSKARLCEKGFTVIDLLKSLGLFEPALFYLKRGLYGPHRPRYSPLSPMPSPSPIQPPVSDKEVLPEQNQRSEELLIIS